MTHLSEVFDLALFEQRVAEGYVRVQTHPSDTLSIANYSEKCVYDRAWDEVTLACRGLIYETDTKILISRPYSKFFNWTEPGTEHLDLNAEVEVTDKIDGSAGILYPDPNGGYAISTRGSFQSEQAIHATKLWKEKYEGKFQLLPGWTYIWEIVYPQNRIVLAYTIDDLVMIGLIENSTGLSVPNPAKASGWPGPSAEVYHYGTLAEALAAEPRPNAEGFVVHFLDTDERIKLKQADYIALHKIITGLSERSVWQHMMDDKPIEELIEPLPDEFHKWTETVWRRLQDTIFTQYTDIICEYTALVDTLPIEYSRKDFAMGAVKSENKWALFALADGRDITKDLLKRAKPAPISPAGSLVEEEII